MPLTLNVGMSRKLGQPDYGSIGASCNVSVELDVSLLTGDPDGFQRHVRNAYAACSRAVNEELARQSGTPLPAPATATAPVADHRYADSSLPNGNGNGAVGDNHAAAAPSANGNGTVGHSNGRGVHAASQKQIGFIYQLARSIRGLDVRQVETLTGRMFGKPLAALSSMDASALIDTLKAIKDGSVSLDAALNGSPT